MNWAMNSMKTLTSDGAEELAVAAIGMTMQRVKGCQIFENMRLRVSVSLPIPKPEIYRRHPAIHSANKVE